MAWAVFFDDLVQVHTRTTTMSVLVAVNGCHSDYMLPDLFEAHSMHILPLVVPSKLQVCV